MKTAISIPDDLFDQAEIAAKRLGVSRSELYAKAVKEFVERDRQADITEKLNAIFSGDDSVSQISPQLASLQAKTLKAEDW